MNQGFTLIELVAVLLLVGVLVASSMVSLIPVAEGLVLARQNAAILRKNRLAFARLSREFSAITEVVAGNSRAIQYVFWDASRNAFNRTLSWSGTSGDPLLLDNVPLTDDVANFQLQYLSGKSYAPTNPASAEVIELSMQSQISTTALVLRLSPRTVLFQMEADE